MTNRKFMAAVAKEIIFIKIDCGKPLSHAESQFYKIMRKYGIKQGTKCKDGSVTSNNFEWTMCWELFRSKINDFYGMQLLIENPPADLRHY